MLLEALSTSSSATDNSLFNSSTLPRKRFTSASYCSALRTACANSVDLSWSTFFSFPWECLKSESSCIKHNLHSSELKCHHFYSDIYHKARCSNISLNATCTWIYDEIILKLVEEWGYFIILHKVKYIQHRNSPENWGLWSVVTLRTRFYLGQYGIPYAFWLFNPLEPKVNYSWCAMCCWKNEHWLKSSHVKSWWPLKLYNLCKVN